MKKSILTPILLTCVLALASCASITGPSRQAVKINSSPQGAKVFVDGRDVITPAVVELKGKSQYYVKYEKAGYESTSKVIGSEVRILPAVVGNFFNLSGIIGIAVDFFGTGAAYKLDKEVNADLRRK